MSAGSNINCAFAIIAVFVAVHAVAASRGVPPPKPCKVDDFEIIKAIGGTKDKTMVYLVKHKTNGRPYAMKKYSKQEMYPRAWLERSALLDFVRGTPGVVEAYCTMQDDNYAYIVMEYVPGGDLFTIRLGTELTEEMFKFYVASIALILDGIHRNGAIHCSVLPENVVIDENGYVRLVDWATSTTWRTGVKATVFQGTTEFCAPEVIETHNDFVKLGLSARRDGYTGAADWWSLGIFICDLFEPGTPFRTDGRDYADAFEWKMAVFRKIMTTAEDKIEVPEGLPPGAYDLVRRLLRHNPEERLSFDQIKSLDWFKGFDWEALALGDMPAPYKPPLVGGPFDTANFKDTVSELPPATSIDDRQWSGFDKD